MKEVTNAKTGAKTQEAVVGDFSWFTYKQVQEKIDNLGSGIVHLGLAPANDLGVSETRMLSCALGMTHCLNR